MTNIWTPEREDLARRMWTEGRSATEIAREMGGLSRLAVIGKIHRMGLGREAVAAKAKGEAKPGKTCAFPGCSAGLYPDSISGLCRTHNHAKDLCQCHSCTNTTPQPRIADRGDVRVAEVPYSTSNSGVALRAKVSLKREPWASA